jgi:hypothetical protein
MNYPRDPNEMNPRPAGPMWQDRPVTGETNSTAERNEMRRAESRRGMIPGIVGIIIVLALGFTLFARGDRTPTPSRTTATQTPATTPKTTPTQPQ